MEMNVDNFNAMYRMFSVHTHSSPMSFYRSEPGGRGSGVVNLTDSRLMAVAIECVLGFPRACHSEMSTLFKDIVKIRKSDFADSMTLKDLLTVQHKYDKKVFCLGVWCRRQPSITTLASASE